MTSLSDTYEIGDHVHLVIKRHKIPCRVTARFMHQRRYDLEDLETGEKYWAIWHEDTAPMRPEEEI